MSGVYCYIQRAGAGATIRGLRLADRRQVRDWTPGAASGAEGHAQTIAAAARWIAEQMAQVEANVSRRVPLVLCLDLDGGRCAWLSPPSAEHEVVKAAARSAALGAADESSAGPGLGSVWSSEYGESGADMSIQELADPPAQNGSGGGLLARRKPAAVGHKERLAVLAVPDAAARVLLDELDRLGVEVASVTTLWHALAAAWDPSKAEALSGGVLERNGSHREVASSEPVTAVVALEPSGRLVWSWTREGKLIAAGTQRLRCLEVAKGMPRAEEDAAGAGGTRRLPEGDAPPARLLEVSRADTGRTVSEWLAWTAQLGVAPSRLVCVGPGELVPTGLADAPGLAAVGQTLAAAWPGSAATAAEEDDPIAATLLRLAAAEAPIFKDDDAQGRALMIDLSSRPGRLSRTMHWWLAAAGAAAAVALGALAWQIDRGAKQTLAAAAQEAGVRAEQFKRVESQFPKLATDPDPVRALSAGLNELRKGREDIAPERPVVDVVERVVIAAEGFPTMKLKKISISGLTGIGFDFAVVDSEPGGKMLEALRKMGPLSDGMTVNWNGDTTTTTSTVVGMSEPMRLFRLRGQWQDRKVAAPGGKPKENR
jgi:hypothetical protein